MVDGESFTSGESLDIQEGHWFWSGESYCWRPEMDNRQPDGITRSVVVNIPVGRNRILDFNSNVWRGKVEIRTNQDVWIVDTYAENESIQSVQIGQSEEILIAWNFVIDILSYFLPLCIFIFIATCVVAHIETARQFVEKNKWVIFYAVIALAQLVLALKYAGIDCFWLDELCEVGWSVQANHLMERAFIGFAPLPIYYVFLHLWYSIAPYGEAWLLIP